MNQYNKEFEPFGPEWKKEVMKLDKSTLIDDFLTPALKKNIQLEEDQNKLLSCSAIVENEQVELFFQFDDDEPISAMKCNGKKFTMEMIPIKNNFVTFTDGKKTMKLFVKHCN